MMMMMMMHKHKHMHALTVWCSLLHFDAIYFFFFPHLNSFETHYKAIYLAWNMPYI